MNETWFKSADVNGKVIHDMVPQHYDITHIPRPVAKRGGGNALVYHQSTPVGEFRSQPDTTNISSFELLEGPIKCTPPIYILCVYRLQEIPITQFIDELETLLSARFTTHNNLILLGDVNIHINIEHDPDTIKFCELLDSFNLNILSNAPTL